MPLKYVYNKILIFILLTKKCFMFISFTFFTNFKKYSIKAIGYLGLNSYVVS